MKYIRQAITFYFQKENLIFFSSVMGIVALVLFSVNYLFEYFLPGISSGNIDYKNLTTVSTFICFAIVVGSISVYKSTLEYVVLLKNERGLKKVFKLALNYTPRFFGYSLVLMLILLGGAILLIIPFIIFGNWFAFTLFFALDKNLGLKDSLVASKNIVAGKFWKVLGNFLLFGLFAILIQLIVSPIPYVGQLLISIMAPLFLLPSYFLYQELSEKV